MYIKELKRLAPLESFDPKVFIPSSQSDKQLCGMVLSLAVVYNDLKDVVMSLQLLMEIDPQVNKETSPEIGQHMGLGVHLMRTAAGIIHELMVLINNNKALVNSNDFLRFTRKLSSDARKAWEAIVSISFQKTTSHPISNYLLFIRNKVAFHYDQKEILRGYSLAFPQDKPNIIPYVSRGKTMPETRFYFADRAAEMYLLEGRDEDIGKRFITGRISVFKKINIALYEIITKFVNDRGYAWRKT